MFTRTQILAAVLVLVGMFAAEFYTSRALRTFAVHLVVECAQSAPQTRI